MSAVQCLFETPFSSSYSVFRGSVKVPSRSEKKSPPRPPFAQRFFTFFRDSTVFVRACVCVSVCACLRVWCMLLLEPGEKPPFPIYLPNHTRQIPKSTHQPATSAPLPVLADCKPRRHAVSRQAATPFCHPVCVAISSSSSSSSSTDASMCAYVR